MIDYQIPLEIGGRFELQNIVIIGNKNLTFPLQIITGSPILIRIPCEKFKAESDHSTLHRVIQWRSSYPIELFIDAIESNLNKKFYDFTYSQIKTGLFESFKFKKKYLPNYMWVVQEFQQQGLCGNLASARKFSYLLWTVVWERGIHWVLVL